MCEVRDLWPESLVEVGIIKRNSLIAKILYLGEKWIYKRADKLIFTMPGGLNYIQDREWDEIQIKKIININNGVDLDEYIANEENVLVEDKDLDEDRTFKSNLYRIHKNCKFCQRFSRGSCYLSNERKR